MSLHVDENAVRQHAAAVASKSAKRKSRKIWVLAAAGVLVAGGGAAYAAMAIKGDGTASAAAGTAADLVITNGHFSGPLFPGTKIDLIMSVKNNNPFNVKVTTIGLQANATPTVTCDGSDAQYLSGPLGNQQSSVALPAGDQVTIAGNGATSTVTVHNAIQLSNSATKGCALTVPFTLGGESAGN